MAHRLRAERRKKAVFLESQRLSVQLQALPALHALEDQVLLHLWALQAVGLAVQRAAELAEQELVQLLQQRPAVPPSSVETLREVRFAALAWLPGELQPAMQQALHHALQQQQQQQRQELLLANAVPVMGQALLRGLQQAQAQQAWRALLAELVGAVAAGRRRRHAIELSLQQSGLRVLLQSALRAALPGELHMVTRAELCQWRVQPPQERLGALRAQAAAFPAGPVQQRLYDELCALELEWAQRE